MGIHIERPPLGTPINSNRMLRNIWHTPTMVDTFHRKNGQPSFIIYCFIGIFQNHDSPPPSPRTNRGRMLNKIWHTPTMVDTFHRKNGNPSIIIFHNCVCVIVCVCLCVCLQVQMGKI